jgi:hypothetical protein
MQVSAGSFETAGLRGEDKMEDRHIICCPLSEAGPSTHLLGEQAGTQMASRMAEPAAHALFLAFWPPNEVNRRVMAVGMGHYGEHI